jgi:hypothetical protein
VTARPSTSPYSPENAQGVELCLCDERAPHDEVRIPLTEFWSDALFLSNRRPRLALDAPHASHVTEGRQVHEFKTMVKLRVEGPTDDEAIVVRTLVSET